MQFAFPHFYLGIAARQADCCYMHTFCTASHPRGCRQQNPPSRLAYLWWRQTARGKFMWRLVVPYSNKFKRTGAGDKGISRAIPTRLKPLMYAMPLVHPCIDRKVSGSQSRPWRCVSLSASTPLQSMPDKILDELAPACSSRKKSLRQVLAWSLVWLSVALALCPARLAWINLCFIICFTNMHSLHHRQDAIATFAFQVTTDLPEDVGSFRHRISCLCRGAICSRWLVAS